MLLIYFSVSFVFSVNVLLDSWYLVVFSHPFSELQTWLLCSRVLWASLSLMHLFAFVLHHTHDTISGSLLGPNRMSNWGSAAYKSKAYLLYYDWLPIIAVFKFSLKIYKTDLICCDISSCLFFINEVEFLCILMQLVFSELDVRWCFLYASDKIFRVYSH